MSPSRAHVPLPSSPSLLSSSFSLKSLRIVLNNRIPLMFQGFLEFIALDLGQIGLKFANRACLARVKSCGGVIGTLQCCAVFQMALQPHFSCAAVPRSCAILLLTALQRHFAYAAALLCPIFIQTSLFCLKHVPDIRNTIQNSFLVKSNQLLFSNHQFNDLLLF